MKIFLSEKETGIISPNFCPLCVDNNPCELRLFQLHFCKKHWPVFQKYFDFVKTKKTYLIDNLAALIFVFLMNIIWESYMGPTKIFYFIAAVMISVYFFIFGITFFVVRTYPIRYPFFLPIPDKKGLVIESTNEKWNTEFIEKNRGLIDAESFLIDKGILSNSKKE